MNCDFCGEPLDSGKHPRDESGSYDVTDCQLVFLFKLLAAIEGRVVEIRVNNSGENNG